MGELRAEIRIVDRAGEIRWIDVRGRVADTRTRASRFLGTMIDITDRVRLMQELGDLLHEKDILLTEVHHRVKNNLQAICGLLQVESNRLRHNPEARERMHLIGQRIAVLGSIHQHLYTSDNVAEVRIADHFRRLCETLWGSYLDRPVNLTVEAEPLCCDLDTALPLGLIAHELVINSIKHGCADDRQGNVRIGLHHHPEIGRVVLTVSDDGPGPQSEKSPGRRGLPRCRAWADPAERAGGPDRRHGRSQHVERLPDDGVDRGAALLQLRRRRAVQAAIGRWRQPEAADPGRSGPVGERRAGGWVHDLIRSRTRNGWQFTHGLYEIRPAVEPVASAQDRVSGSSRS